MKFIIAAVLSLLSSSSFAVLGGPQCEVRSKNAASVQLAQEVVVPVQQTEVTSFFAGPSTKMANNNTGFNIVEVQSNDLTKRYKIFAQQLGSSSDCKIIEVTEVAVDNL